MSGWNVVRGLANCSQRPCPTLDLNHRSEPKLLEYACKVIASVHPGVVGPRLHATRRSLKELEDAHMELKP